VKKCFHNEQKTILSLEFHFSSTKDFKWKLCLLSEIPVYEMEPNNLPAGESILWALAKEKGVIGLRYPGEDDTYEKAILKKIGRE
jgi:hypothetical protein